MGEIKIGKITLGVCQTNTYFIYREECGDAIVIDPADKGEYIYEKLKEKGFCVKHILLTHGHFDHIWGVEGMKAQSGADVYASEDETELLNDPGMNCSRMFKKPCTVIPDVSLKDGETVNLCNMDIRMIKTPGHTIGSCCFYIEEAGFLISGDTLFNSSVGRTDFPTGSMSSLIRSIKEKLLILPDETKVYPGHGDATSIAFERENNPFI